MLATLLRICVSFTRNADSELKRAAIAIVGDRYSRERVALRCYARQVSVATFVVERSAPAIGKQTMSLHTAPAANTRQITIFRRIPSATITDGTMMLTSSNGFSSLVSGCVPKSRTRPSLAKRRARTSVHMTFNALGGARRSNPRPGSHSGSRFASSLNTAPGVSDVSHWRWPTWARRCSGTSPDCSCSR